MSGRIPKDFIDQLINRVDIVDIINSRVSLKKQGREYTACCPFHSEKTPSFTVSPNKQFYHCFGCGAHGSVITFLMEYEHLEYVEAIEALAEHLNLEVPRESFDRKKTPPPRKTDNSLYELIGNTADYYCRQLKNAPQAIDYLKQRGLTGDLAKQFQLGYSLDEWSGLEQQFPQQSSKLLAAGLLIKNEQGRLYDRFRGRLMFPIRDRRGRVIGFGGRVLNDSTPKYLNSPETEVFHKGQELYGFYEARQHTRKLERLLVVEGYMDVIALAQFEISYAVATLGTATTPEHIQQLFRTVPEVIFCFDGDRAGRQAAWRALETALPELRDDREIRFLFLPTGEDPDSLVRQIGKEAFEAKLTSDSVPLSDYLLQGLIEHEHCNPASSEGRAKLINVAGKALGRMPNIELKEQIIAKLARDVTRSDLNELQLRERLKQAVNQPDYIPNDQELGQARTKTLSDQAVRVTPIRFAITLLLHYPHFIEHVGNPEQWARYSLPGIDLLLSVIEIIEDNPHIHSAALLEQFRNTSYENVLLKLMNWQPQKEADDAVIQQEFQDCLQKIAKQGKEKQLEDLIHQGQIRALTEQEKHDMSALLIELNTFKHS